MKRKGNLFQLVHDPINLQIAHANAQRGKKQSAIRAFNKNKEAYLSELRDMLAYGEFTTSPYSYKKVFDPKERDISCLPYYPDRIVHWSLAMIIRPILESSFTADTYACIKGRGIHKASYALRKALRNVPESQYCLKIDIKKFYPSVNQDILKSQLRRKIKDTDLLKLLDEIIESAPGLPIGNLLSQVLSNFYLSQFDHWIKEQKRVKHYFRYADDIVIVASTKEELHKLSSDIHWYLLDNLKLQVGKSRVFPTWTGIDFLGYVHYHNYTRLRKRIKQRFARAIARFCSMQTVMSYQGWASHANTNHLLKKLLYDNKKFQLIQRKNEAQRVRWAQSRCGGVTPAEDYNRALRGEAVEVQNGSASSVFTDTARGKEAGFIQSLKNIDRLN